MKYATGADDPCLKETTWPLPCEEMTFLQERLRAERSADTVAAASVIAAYRSLIEASTTAVQQRRLAALRRAFKRSR